jgi:4,5-DOPA dioxygenase extradiol
MNVLADNGYTRSLQKLGRELPRPEAIMVISAHWLTSGTYVTCAQHPRTIHDFYGFPQELYRIRYPSPGSPEKAKAASAALGQSESACDYDWGLDHASWAVLKHMYPQADIPVFEMSLDYSFNDWNSKPVSYHYELGQKLRALREQGILIIGSGNMVHNLRVIDFDTEAQPFDWAVSYDAKLRSRLLDGNHKALVNYASIGKEADLAVPTLDHYLPMIYVLALHDKDEPLTFTYEGIQNASVSMRCFRIG